MPPHRRTLTRHVALTGLALLAAACGDTSGLPAPFFTNVVDTASLFALRGTALTLPSAYTLEVNLGQLSGLQRSTTLFDGLKLAPTSGYIFDKPLTLDTGTVVLVRSRPMQCLFGATVSLYAKLRVLGVDSTARRLDFEILVDQNCGYRGLEPGLPKQ